MNSMTFADEKKAPVVIAISGSLTPQSKTAALSDHSPLSA